jgi:hypothetical protein
MGAGEGGLGVEESPRVTLYLASDLSPDGDFMEKRTIVAIAAVAVGVVALIAVLAVTEAGPFHKKEANVFIEDWEALSSPYGGTTFYIQLNNTGDGMGDVVIHCMAVYDGYEEEKKQSFFSPPGQVRECEIVLSTPMGYYDFTYDCWIEQVETIG